VTFLEKEGIHYRTDSSNFDRAFLRNKIRLDILPELEKINPNLKRRSVRGELARPDYQFIRQEALKNWSGIAEERNGISIAFDMKKFASVHEALKKELFREAVNRLKGDLRKVAYSHWQDFHELITRGQSGRELHLPEISVSCGSSSGYYLCAVPRPSSQGQRGWWSPYRARRSWSVLTARS